MIRFPAAALVAAICIAGGQVALSQPPPPDGPAPALPGGSGALSPDDARFLHEMARDGQAEVKLGKLAEKNAVDAEVRKFADRMMKEQTVTNSELKELAGKKGVKLPTDLGRHAEKISRLSSDSGKDFDRNFMRAMVKDHEKAVRDLTRAARECNDADLRAWAAKTLKLDKQHENAAKEISQRMGGGGKTAEDDKGDPPGPPSAPPGQTPPDGPRPQ